MKKMKKLFFSVFALSALILSACSGGGDDEPVSTPAAESSQTTPAQSSDAGGGTSAATDDSSAGEDASSQQGSGSSQDTTVKADYKVTIGSNSYDLVLDESNHGHTKQYNLGTTGKAVAAGDAVSFQRLANDQYSAFAVEPSGDDTDGLTYNNVQLDGTTYKIRAAGTVQLYLKLDGETWSYWISGGGAMADPWFTSYKLAYGADYEANTWAFANALAGTKADSDDENVAKQLKFTITTTAAVGAKVRNNADGDDAEWYGENFAQEAYRDDYPEQDNNIALDASSTYDIYFKLLASGQHEIWVHKEIVVPTSIQHLYVSLDTGDVQELTKGTAPDTGYNQFKVENVPLTTATKLYVWADSAKTVSGLTLLNDADNNTQVLLKQNMDGSIGTDFAGSYSFYFNEETEGHLKLYTVRAEGLPTQKVKFNVPYATTDGESLYVVGDFNDWKAVADYKLHYKEGNWVVSTTDENAGFDLPLGSEFKLVVAATTDPSEDPSSYTWEAGDNREVTDLLESVTSWNTITYSMTINGANSTALTDTTATMTAEDNKYAEYKGEYTVLAPTNERIDILLGTRNIQSIVGNDHVSYSGNIDENGFFTVPGECDIYVKLFNGTDQHSGETYYVVWSSTPEVVHTYVAKVNETPFALANNTSTDKTDGRLAEYYGSITATAGDTLSFTVDGTPITANIGPDVKEAQLVKGNNIDAEMKVRSAGTYNVWIKVYSDHYSVWLEGLQLAQKTYNVSLGSFAVEGKVIMLHSWGGEKGDRDQVLYSGTGAAPTSFTLDFDTTGYLFCRLKAGETEYGTDWANKDLQTGNGAVLSSDVTSATNPTVVVGTEETPSLTLKYAAGELTFSITPTTAVASGKAVYLVGSLTSGWTTANLVKLTNNDGTWSKTIDVAAGSYEYKYVITADTDPASIEDWTTLNQDNRAIVVA